MARAGERRAQGKVTAAIFAGRRRRFRSRIARLHAAHSYRTVLLLIAATFVFASLAGDATWTASVLLVLEAVTLSAAMWTSGLARADSKVLIALVAAATITAVALPFSSSHRLLAATGLASGVLVVATIVAIAIGVLDQEEVNAQSITGAISIYLLFGILFLFLYSAVALLGSGDFFAQGTDGTRALRLYFSFVTLATLGYGDYTPAGELGHTLAVLEALFGQLYLVTVLTLLVSQLRGKNAD
jgi:voltage-gated potassium channel